MPFVFYLIRMLATMIICMASMPASFHGASDRMITQVAASQNNWNLVLPCVVVTAFDQRSNVLIIESVMFLTTLTLLFGFIETSVISVIWTNHLPIWIPELKENFCMHQYVYIYLVIDML